LFDRFLKIDALTLRDHFYLDEQDECYYAGEYTAREGHSYSEINQLIFNFKKSVATRGTPQWHYKEKAILRAAEIFRLRLRLRQNVAVTFVPVPPSKTKDDPMYDDRMLRMLEALSAEQLDIRELIIQEKSTQVAHTSTIRPTLEHLIENYTLNESQAIPIPKIILIIDDVLTTGCHFKAMQHILNCRFPQARIAGFFIARRVSKAIQFGLNH
jgi:hypothetical protein